MVARQPTLFDDGAAGLRPLDGDVERADLGRGAWVELRREWVTHPAVLFDRLFGSVPWRTEQRVMYGRVVDVPRLVCSFGKGAALPDPLLDEAVTMLNGRYGEDDPFTTVGCCLYRAGGDSVAWHGDRIGRGATHDTVVALVSLGGPRRFLLRPRQGGSAVRYTLGSGDLLVMGGSCQRTWEHAVPKTSRRVEARISVQFRAAGVG